MGRNTDSSAAAREPNGIFMRPRSREVSPELVLVDPELARAERARLEERATLAEYLATARPPEPAPGATAERARPRRRSAAVLAFATLIAAGLASAWFLAGSSAQVTSGPETTGAVEAAAVPPTTFAAPPKITLQAPSPRVMLERRLLALVADAPAAKLPRRLVDVHRHAARLDLRAACSRVQERVFRCVIRAPRRPATEGLYVKYRLRQGGGGVFAWGGYHR
jgi:hypothetical protein